MQWYVYIVICHVFVKCLAVSISELEDFSNFLRQTSQLDQNVKSNIPHDELDDDELISDHAWEKSGKFEGDLVLNEKQRKMILTNVAEGLARNGLTDSTKRWPNNEVVYFVQVDHFNNDQMEAIQNGIDDLARVSCVKFRPYVKGDRDAVVIQGSRRGCFSQVGYQGGFQVLNLSRRHPAGRGCFRHGTVVHELLHTLGFYHMQSSPDRDDYIDVVWENIIKPARHNFKKYNSLSVSDFGVGYDYDSVLHYSRRAFSSNGQDTIIPKKLGAEIGQRIGLSEKDVQKVNKMYCDANPDLLIEDSSEIKKSAKLTKADGTKPFVGVGLGYQKGTLVIIKLPREEKRQMDTVPEYPIYDYGSKTKQDVPPAFVEEVEEEEEIQPQLWSAPVSDEEYTKFLKAAFPEGLNLKIEQPHENGKGRTSSDFLNNLTGYRSSSNKANPNYSLRQPEEDDHNDPRMRLFKESELKKLNSYLVSPLINDDIKDSNNYVINGPITHDIPKKSYQSYVGNLHKQSETDNSTPIVTQSYGNYKLGRLTESGQNLPDNSLWHKRYNLKQKYSSPLRSYNSSPSGDAGYQYYYKDVPAYEQKYKSGPQKNEAYRE